MHILFLGDIVGSPGRKVVKNFLPELREIYKIDLVIANGENAAGGRGITPPVMNELFNSKVDIITTGNHIWDRKEILGVINEETRLIRPANMSLHAPGKGVALVPCGDYFIGVLNIMGRIFMPPVDCPFQVAAREIALLQKVTPNIIVDFHAEATSEKLAMGWFLKKKVSAIIGTHTHIQTADERIYMGKTAYISDAGMVGPYNSILGLDPDLVLDRFLKGLPINWQLASGECILNGIYLHINPLNGKALEIKRIVKKYNI
ncbi:MAG: TIGR00282 family metallophosphoesterase [Dethiobacter sp.]|nr:MAG: TIGR00282 family metallophosphoesterase [Dethiobacter sp.]